MYNFTEKEMEIINESFESKTEVLLDCYGRVVTEEDLDYLGEKCSDYVEVKEKDTLERFIRRIKIAKEELDEAVYKAAYNNGMVW